MNQGSQSALGKGPDGAIVNVSDESRLAVEVGIRALIVSLEVLSGPRHLRWPLHVLQDLHQQDQRSHWATQEEGTTGGGGDSKWKGGRQCLPSRSPDCRQP